MDKYNNYAFLVVFIAVIEFVLFLYAISYFHCVLQFVSRSYHFRFFYEAALRLLLFDPDPVVFNR